MLQATIKGRASGAGSGDPQDLTATQATAILNVFGADSGAGGLKGLTPATVAGDAAKYLRGDGTWATNAGGDVTGPASATDNAIAVYNSTTGKLIKNSLVIVSPTGSITGVVDLAATGQIGGAFASFLTTVNIGTNGGTSGSLTLNTAGGNPQIIQFQVGGVNRWLLENDASVNFVLNARDSGGSNIDSPITIVNAAGGLFTITRPVSMGSTLAVTGLITGSISGNAATVTTNANLTGPVTSVGNATTIADAELAALAGLTSAADKIPYFTGSGTAALADFTAAARTVLDDATVAAMVNTLGGATSTGTGGLVRITNAALVTPDLGTPSALVGTNIIGTASGLTAGNVATNANLTGDVTSVGNAATIPTSVISTVMRTVNDDTTLDAAIVTLFAAASLGTGGAVRGTSPTLTTPTLGVAAATSINIASGGAVSQLVASTTWSPTFSAKVNLDSDPATFIGKWIRVAIGAADLVVFGFVVTVDPTAGAPTGTAFEMTLPVASNFAGSTNAHGIGVVSNSTGQSPFISSSAANDTLVVNWSSSTTASGQLRAVGFYQVI